MGKSALWEMFENRTQFAVFCGYISIWCLHGQLVTWSKSPGNELGKELKIEIRNVVNPWKLRTDLSALKILNSLKIRGKKL